ncbi:MAG: hypothetical protein GAK35_01887 [Herbaspirillum frisingense]|uniref:Type IV pilus modification protein PilV n=1 Tax=Herbaspirillum frisingense TaxID=92645 RepID=A0A7V8FX84_9BURK|nr:MAG: hypothetical protein GAK35_01887 [Herbaspirillum frisingense]
MSSSSSGFTMLEVLVAMLVIGTGALAMIMLQLHALRSSRENSLQATATMMAQELAELRAAYRPTADAADPYLFVFDASRPIPVAADCASAPCDADAFAAAAIGDWNTRLARDFPAARAVVCRDGRADAHADWRCDGDPAAPAVLKLSWRRALSGGAPEATATPLMAIVLGR